MNRDTLVGFFEDLGSKTGEFLVHDDGYRTRRYRYQDVAAAARGFAGRLHETGLRKGDAVLLWAENRPEWIAAFWGCVIAGIVVVPIDYRSSLEFARRVGATVRARVALVGDDVPAVDAEEAGRHGLIGGIEVWRLSHLDWRDRRSAPPVPLTRDDVAEIIFTSGATAEPKGVVITHRNVLANIVPIEGEVLKYRRWGRPFFPLRFLNLLPLSHMFGQVMATFIPPMLPGTVVFMRGYNPSDIVAQVRKRRVSVLVSVPKILDVLAEHVRRTWPGAADALPAPEHVARRWWRYRTVHRAFGLKFWSFVVGAAPLEPAIEEFWSRLGFLVIQGYGLTEAAPIVSLNHPFKARKGSVGKAIGGVELKIAADGEILVRGDNVTRGYYRADRETAEAFEGGWLHTGDIGELDAQGRLFVKGRKKEMIVTPEGLNVFPEDVERVVSEQPGVLDSAVVGITRGGEERVHAVVVVEPGTDVDRIAREANAVLADHQRVRGISIWPAAELPRTEGTRKLKRREIEQWVETGTPPRSEPSSRQSLEAILAHYAGGRDLRPDTTIEELGLSSLERVELMVALEEKLHSSIDESRFADARNVGDIRALLAAGNAPAPGARRVDQAWKMPVWNRSGLITQVRRASLAACLLPLTRLFARIRVEGLEHVAAIDGPVVFASNHQSHLDTPVILAALPGRQRTRVAVAMAKEFFDAHFHPGGHSRRERFASGISYYLAAFFFNAFPLPQREAGARQTLRYIGDLISDGWSVLIYPEGERSDSGGIGVFRPGVGMIGARLSVPVIPVRLEGVDRVLHKSWKMARPGRVRVAFGRALELGGEDYARLAGCVESAVRSL
ncbi:MAG TPA: AMP-binding protein [Vicinamibacterales bacterium]